MGSSSCCRCSRTEKDDSDFEKIYSCTANGIVSVTKYISKNSGLTVVHADIEGPIVSGYICVPTRAQDDDGLPHTLEHLIFLGSEGYPYPSILDRLANKCLASGTNAWTDVDHTCYSLSTAGNDGFCKLLPIYMDHILFPLLTDAAFITEVHHVNGRGNDGGVIYSEIQALEQTSFSKASEMLYKELYPSNSGYRWNVGGALNNLRETCNNEKVRAFHRKFYHPRNICVIICGKVDVKQIFRVLYPGVMKMVHRESQEESSPKQKSVKPWLAEENAKIPDVPSAIEKTILFPSTDETDGCLVLVGLLGPSLVNCDLDDKYALILLLRYLTKSSYAPLQKELVEKEIGLLATSLDFNMVEYRRIALSFELDGVSPEDVKNVVNRLKKCLQAQLLHFDVGRMKDVIRSSIQGELSLMETSPHVTISASLIRDFMYGDNDLAKFEKQLNPVCAFEKLSQNSESFWKDLIKNTILYTNWVLVCAEPNMNLMKELAAKEETRILQRRQLLGDQGLSKYAYELDDAMLINSKAIPPKILNSVKIPSVKSTHYHKINRIKNPAWISEFPAILCLDDISTNFVYVGLIMDTSQLGDEYRKFLPLFREVILSSPISEMNTTGSDEDMIPFEEVCASRDKSLQACELDFGLEQDFQGAGTKFSCGSFSHIMALGLQMELDKVEEGMRWIRKIFWQTRFTKERIKTTVNKMLGEVFHLKREGSQMSHSILKHMIYKDTSNVYNSNIITQWEVLQELGAEDERKIMTSMSLIKSAFEAILNVIRDPNNISLHIAADVEKMCRKLEKLPCENLDNLLKKCFPFGGNDTISSVSKKVEKSFANFPDTGWMIPLSQIGNNETGCGGGVYTRKNQIIYGLTTEDSSYLAMIAPGPTSFLDSDLPALLTTLQYFTQQEGPFYKKIRGEGYAYSYNAFTKITESLIYFHLYRCADLVGAYSACLGIISNHLSQNLWSEDMLMAARSSLIFECLETERTPLSLAANSCLDYYRNVPRTYMKDLIGKISKVKMKDVKKMTKKYLDTLFHCSKNNYATVVICPEEEAEVIQKRLEQIGKHMRIVHSLKDL